MSPTVVMLIQPVEDAYVQLRSEGMDLTYERNAATKADLSSIITVRHVARRSGRGRPPLHRLIFTLDDSTSLLELKTWYPHSDGSSRPVESHLSSENDDDIVESIKSWVNDVVSIEKKNYIVETADDSIEDDETETVEDNSSDNDTTSQPARAHRDHNYDPFAVMNQTVIERTQRPVKSGDAVYIVHTPKEHIDIPAGCQGIILEQREEEHADDCVLVELTSTLFSPNTSRWINVTDLVFVDQPEVQVCIYES